MWSREAVPTSQASYSISGGGCCVPDALPAPSFPKNGGGTRPLAEYFWAQSSFLMRLFSRIPGNFLSYKDAHIHFVPAIGTPFSSLLSLIYTLFFYFYNVGATPVSRLPFRIF